MQRAVLALLLVAAAAGVAHAARPTTVTNSAPGPVRPRRVIEHIDAMYDQRGNLVGGDFDAASGDSLYWKDYYSTSYLKSSAKDQDPAPADRTAMAFQDTQTVVGMDPNGDYVYEVYGYSMRRFSTTDGSYTSYTLTYAGNGACGTDGQYVFVPRSGAPSSIDKYSTTGSYVNTTTVDYSATAYGFAVANDTVWLTPVFSGTPIYYGYACSEFTGGSISSADSWPMPSVGGSTPMNIAWDGQYYYVGSGGYNTNPFFRFYADRTLCTTGTASSDCRSVMCTGLLRKDAACIAILAPADSVDSGATVTPQAVIQNAGTAEETFAAWFAIGADYADTVALTLAAGETDTVEFAGWDALDLGTFPVACSTMLSGDVNAANDVVHDSVEVVTFTAVGEHSGLPTGFWLDGAAPNPTNGRASIRYGLPVSAQVRISVFSTAGPLVRTLQSGVQQAGYHRASWDGRDARGRAVGTGVYLVRMEAGRFSATRKLVVRL
jgi:hypothetical protein